MNFAPGFYRAVLTGGILGQTQKQKPQMVLTWNVNAVAVNGDWQAIEPADVRMYLSMSGGAVQYTEDKLVSLGFNGDFSNPKFGTQATQDGMCIEAYLDTYEGKTSLKWQLQRGPSEVEPAPDNVVRQLQAQWNQRHKPVQRPAAAKPMTTPPKAAAKMAPATVPPSDEPPADEPPPGDSIPF